MQDIFQELQTSHNLAMGETEFYASSFKALLLRKVEAYRAAHALPHQGSVPRFARGAGGSKKFYGVRLKGDGAGASGS